MRRLMDLEATLRTAVGNLGSNRLENEAQVKQAVILPVLRALGWDDADPVSFRPEFAVEGGYVDYALLDRLKPRIFVEAKRMGAISADGESQLFRYAANKGVPLLVLTDGNVWALYLSMAEGSPSERRFFEVELQRGDISTCVEDFNRFLSKNRVIAGKARQAAEQRHERVRSRMRAREGLQSAWQALLGAPDDMLVEILAEQVEADSGSKPDLKDVESFLTGLTSSASPRPPTPQPGPKLEKPKRKPRQPGSGGKIVGFKFHERRIDTRSAIDTLTQVIQELDRNDSRFMQRLAEQTSGKRRRLVARQPGDLYSLAYLGVRSVDLGNGWWMATNYGVAAIQQHIKTACKVAGIEFGRQLVLIVEH